ncbi:MAG TPA: hypothetical protein VGR35_10595 [Tepidisphaeraceae bacterium]|nr:hypothetical protein [Tepidisphaeraceae bacterium]
MPESDKPKVPPIQQHRSSGDTGIPQRGGDMADDARQAVESGEQDETSRSRGRVIDDSGQPQGHTKNKAPAGKGEHWESGRHKAQ